MTQAVDPKKEGRGQGYAYYGLRTTDTVRIQCGLKSSYGTSYGTASYLSRPSFLFFSKSLFRVALSLLIATREQEARRHKPVELAIWGFEDPFGGFIPGLGVLGRTVV